MKEERLILDGSVCEGDIVDGVDTVDQLEALDEKERCRFFPAECPVLNGAGPYCIAKSGQEVARFMTKLGTSLEEELEDFSDQAPMPARGYFDPTIEEPDQSTTDRDEVVKRVGLWAEKTLGIQHADAGSHNQEYKAPSTDKNLMAYPVLAKSIFDEDTSAWIHSCGATLAEAIVNHSVHLKALPLAGTGEVKRERVPYCPSCGEAPNPYGPPVYAEDLEVQEQSFIRELGKPQD